MRNIRLRIEKNITGEILVLPTPSKQLSPNEYEGLQASLRELAFLRSYCSRLTIRLAAWDAVEAAFKGYRIRVIPDESETPEKYADILFSIEANNEQ